MDKRISKQHSRAQKNQALTYHSIKSLVNKERNEVEVCKVTLYSPSGSMSKIRSNHPSRAQNNSISTNKNTLNKSLGNTTTYTAAQADKSISSSMKTMNMSTNTGRHSQNKKSYGGAVDIANIYLSPQNKNLDLLTKLLNKELTNIAGKKKSLDHMPQRRSKSPVSNSSQRRSEYSSKNTRKNLIVQPKQKAGNFHLFQRLTETPSVCQSHVTQSSNQGLISGSNKKKMT